MKKNIKLIALALLVYGTPLLVWSFLPFSRETWGGLNKSFLLNFVLHGKYFFWPVGIMADLLFLYCLILLFVKEKYIKIEKKRVYFIYCGLAKILKWIFVFRIKNKPDFTEEEKTSLLFYMVKLVFTPVMLNFLVGNANGLLALLNVNYFPITKTAVISFYLPFIFNLILVLDTLIFAFGYLFESPALKNVVKSVEPTALGWIVVLICYPPINGLSAEILGWYSSDLYNFKNQNLTIIAGTISTAFYMVYLWASIALGAKASNLTNRGIVSKGPYKYVRHPAYISKNISWWIMGFPFIATYGPVAVLSLVVWSFVYYLRALTEERHLSKDPDYLEYSKKVKYMFIPGVF